MVPWFDLPLQGLIFNLKVLIFDLEVWSLGFSARFGCLFSSPGDPQMFSSRWKRRSWLESLILEVEGASLCTCSLHLGYSVISFLLKEKVLTSSVDLQGRGYVYVLVLFTRIFNLISSLIEEKVLILKVCILDRESFIWGRVLVGDLAVFGGDLGRGLMRPLKMKGVGSIYNENPPLHLRSNFDLGFPLGLYIGFNLIQLDLELDVKV